MWRAFQVCVSNQARLITSVYENLFLEHMQKANKLKILQSLGFCPGDFYHLPVGHFPACDQWFSDSLSFHPVLMYHQKLSSFWLRMLELM